MSRRLIIFILALLLAIVPASALAQAGADDPEDEFLLKINGTLTVPADQTIGTVVMIDGDAIIEGTITDTLFVIAGNAEIAGVVQGDIHVIDGTVSLLDSATVKNVTLYDGEIERAQGATVTGDVNHESFSWSGWDVAMFSAYLWTSMTVLVLVAGLLFAAIGARQLKAAGAMISERTGGTILAALIVGIGLPVVAVALMVTLVGIPLGVGLFLFLLPALWFLGYIVAGTKLGATIVDRARPQTGEHPYLAAVVGLLVLQLVQLAPFIGWLTTFLAGVIGTGALAYYAWTSWRGERPTPEAEAQGQMLDQPAPTA